MSIGLHIQAPEQTTSLTRRERRTIRQRRFVTAREAALAARLARLDYKVSGETGALRPPTKGRTWHKGGRLNAHAPPTGQAWERSSATYVAGIDEVTFTKPIIHHRWRRLMDRNVTDDTTQ